MTTTEKNVLIAEFMKTKSALIDDKYFGEDGLLYFAEDLRYDFNWSWLMPVVDKIESLNIEIDGVITSFDVIIIYGDCNIRDEDGMGILEIYHHSTDSISKIEAVYNAVVEFILWYNTNKNI